MVEIKGFGCNAVTIAFIGTVACGILQMWGFKAQSDNVWRSRDGASVSVPRFLGLSVYALAAFAYGVGEQKLAIIFDGIFLFPFTASTVLGLIRRKGFTRLEAYVAAIMTLMAIGVTTAPEKAPWFLATAVCCYVISWDQPLEILRRKRRGVVSGRMLATIGINLVFWSTYTFCTRDRVLVVMVPLYDLSLIVTVILWVKYPNQ